MKRTIVWLTIGVFLLSGLAPLALAKDPSHTPTHSKGKSASDHEGKGKGHKGKHNVTLELNGTGTGKDNTTYSFTLQGDGTGKSKTRDENTTRVKGQVKVHVVVKDANGTVLREGDVKVKFTAKLKGDGNWTWHLETVGKKGKGMPRLNLRGDATASGDGSWSLEGHGKMVFKAEGVKRSTPVKITESTGTISRA